MHDERKKARENEKNAPPEKTRPAGASGSPRFVERSRGGAFGLH